MTGRDPTGLDATGPVIAAGPRRRPTMLAVTPPTGTVHIPTRDASPFDASEGPARPSTSSWAPLLAHPGFALWLRTPPAVEAHELADLEPHARVFSPWAAARYGPTLAGVADREIPVFIGTCAPALRAALDAPSPELTAALRDRRLAGFIVRSDPDERTLTGLRTRLDSAGGDHLALGRSMHGTPSGTATAADFTIVAPYRTAITPKPTQACGHGVTAALGPLGRLGPLGDAGLAAWIASTDHVIAMGGIDVESAQDAIALGAKGIAGIDAFFGDAARVAQNARAFTALLPPRTR